jgi:hypothetical protein
VYITKYYKNLFGPPTPNNFSIRESNKAHIPQLSVEENKILVADFTEQEVHDAIMQMEKNKAPGPDGFPAEFYQSFWEVIKKDLMAMLGLSREVSYLCFILILEPLFYYLRKKMRFKSSSTDLFVYLT